MPDHADEVILTRIPTKCPNGCCVVCWQPVRAPRRKIRELEGLVHVLDEGRAAVIRGEFNPNLN